jgi:hypothetical protein
MAVEWDIRIVQPSGMYQVNPQAVQADALVDCAGVDGRMSGVVVGHPGFVPLGVNDWNGGTGPLIVGPGISGVTSTSLRYFKVRAPLRWIKAISFRKSRKSLENVCGLLVLGWWGGPTSSIVTHGLPANVGEELYFLYWDDSTNSIGSTEVPPGWRVRWLARYELVTSS